MPVDPAVTRRLIESLSTHLEDHLATWKSSLVDARRDIENLLATLSDKIPAKARPLFPDNLVELMLEDALPPGLGERAADRAERPEERPAGAPTPPDWSLVRGSLAAIESARTQVDVLTRFLTQTNTHASRVALLVLRNDRLTGWKALGFDASGGRDEGVKAIDLGSDDDPFVSEVLRGQRSMIAEPPDESSPLRKALSGRSPARTLLVPMVIRDRLAGVVCADELPGEEGRLNEAAIEVLTFVTGLAVDLLAARKKIPSPTLSITGEPIARFAGSARGDTARAIPAVEFEVESGPRPPSAAAPLAPPAPSPPAPSPAAPSLTAAPPRPAEPESARRRPTDAGEALRALEESAARRPKVETPRPASPPPPDAGLTSAIPILTKPPATPPRPGNVPSPNNQASTGDFTMAFEAIKSAPEMEARTPAGSVAPAPAVETAAPKPKSSASMSTPRVETAANQVRPISGFIPRTRAGQPDSPQRELEDAKRLARLLISEIKLYNERKVEEGRVKGDLYDRLKTDIERSRQVYEERTPENIRRGTDLFHEELVRILADGRAESLGTMG